MAEAKRDENHVPTLLGTSSVDGTTPVVIFADPTTHRLLVDLGGGVTTFLGLTDTPSSYSGEAGKTLVVNGGETALEFSAAGSGDMVLANVQTVTGAKTFNSTKLIYAGSTSGTTTVNATAVAGTTTLTLPAATDTLVGKATTDTLTNKSISLTTNTLTGTSAELATAISDETGTGVLVFGTAPTFTTSITVTGGGVIDSDGIDLVSGNDYEIDGTAVLNATTLGSAVVASSLTSVGTLSSGNVDAAVTDASLTAKGKIEIATVAETNTGTDATRAVSPDGLDGWTGSAQVVTVGTLSAGNADAAVTDASVTAKGKVELATIAETDTGTDATRALTPDGLQGSLRNIRWLVFSLVEAGTDTATATNIYGDFESPIAGTILQSDSTPFFLYANNSTAGTTGTMVVDISIGGTTIMTTNKLDFDSTEKTTTTASTPPDLTTTALAVGDIITIDIDAVHTTAAKGLTVYMAVRET